MKARWRVIVAVPVVLLTAGAPAQGQETTAPAQNEVIGPPQLQDFSLNGTVTVPARSTEPAAPAPRQPADAPDRQQSSQASTTPRPAPSRAQPAPREESPRAASPSASADLAPPTPTRIATPPVAATDEPSLAAQPAFAPASADSALDSSPSGLAMLPWLAAALALGGVAAWYFFRHQRRERYAAAGGIDLFEAPTPVAPPPIRTAPPAVAPTGIVSTRLRPWLEIEFTPDRAVVDDEKAAVAFELSVLNSGSSPARDVLLEASLFSAGPAQDQQIRLFFENPVAKGDRIPVIAPLQRITVNTAVFLARDQVRPIEIEGRMLFVPMIAFNALYGWGRGEGQTSASYLIGKATKGEKLAPFRLDLGPRVFRGLVAREHELRLRK